MKRLITVCALIVLSFSLASCSIGTIQALSTGASAYSSARAATNLYYSNAMVKSLREAEPLFEGYDNVRLEVLITPRNGGKEERVIDAFKDNLAYIVDTDFKSINPGKTVCAGGACSGRTMVIQFKERGYDQNLAQKLLVGDKIRGTLYFIDAGTSNVIKEESLEALKNYEQILRMTHISVATKLLKSIKDQNEIKSGVEKINKIDPIKPEYRDILAES